MTIDVSRDVLFLGAGTGNSTVFYYRCLLPATALKASYCGVLGAPPKLGYATGLIQPLDGGEPQSAIPDLMRYSVIVMQQPHGRGWMGLIRALRKNGKIIIYEVDDYVHGVKGKSDHQYADRFTQQHLRDYEICMRECDAMICSTPYIAERYARWSKHIYVCENGLDLARYALHRPQRSTVNILWAGATGHKQAIMPWMDPVGDAMARHPNTCFVSLGGNYAEYFRPAFGDQRVQCVPWAAIEQYPAAMTMGDIALAPAGSDSWYRGKSDLRWLEAGALAMPTIANPLVYSKIEHRVNGFKAPTPQAVGTYLDAMLRDDALRLRVGQAAQDYVVSERSIQTTSQQWVTAFDDILRKKAEGPLRPAFAA